MAQLEGNFGSKEAFQRPRSPPRIAWKGKAASANVFQASRRHEDSFKNGIKIPKDFPRTQDLGVTVG